MRGRSDQGPKRSGEDVLLRARTVAIAATLPATVAFHAGMNGAPDVPPPTTGQGLPGRASFRPG